MQDLTPRCRIVLLAAVTAALTVASVGAGSAQIRGATPSTPSSATRLPGCPRDVSTHLASTVIAAFNRGDIRTLNRIVAPEPAFEWFSTRNRLGGEAKDR